MQVSIIISFQLLTTITPNTSVIILNAAAFFPVLPVLPEHF